MTKHSVLTVCLGTWLPVDMVARQIVCSVSAARKHRTAAVILQEGHGRRALVCARHVI